MLKLHRFCQLYFENHVIYNRIGDSKTLCCINGPWLCSMSFPMHLEGLHPHKKHKRVHSVGSGGRAVKCQTVNRGDGGSIPPTAVSKLRQFRSPHICLCFSEETLKAGGPFYLVSMPGEVNDPTWGKCVNCN